MPDRNVFSTKSDVAYAELRRMVLHGELAPGSRLSQYELAASLGMSITPLREAIRRLSTEQLVDLDTHRNARVARISAAEARQLLEVRQALDPAAAGLAAHRRTDADLEVLREAAGGLVPVTRQRGEDALDAHRAFHRALYAASRNDVLVHLLDDLWDKADRYRRLGLELPPGDGPRTRDLHEHHRLVDLVADGDADGAHRLMHEHVGRSLTASAVAALEQRELRAAATGPATD